MRTPLRLPLAALVVAVAVSTLPPAARGSDSGPQPVTASTAARQVKKQAARRPAKAAKPATAPGTAGMRVAIDPETGARVRAASPAPASSASPTNPALSRSTEGLREVVMPDGSVMVDLQGRFQEYVVMEIGPDGRRRVRCVQKPPVMKSTASAASATPAPAAPAPASAGR